jgi:hypothetical protein
VGTAKLPVQELIADAPKPDSETLLYDSDGKHALREFQVRPRVESWIKS